MACTWCKARCSWPRSPSAPRAGGCSANSVDDESIRRATRAIRRGKPLSIDDPGALGVALGKAIGVGQVDQVAFLVEDLDTAMKYWSALYRDADWLVYTYDPT